MHLNKNYIKISLNALLIFACVFLQQCKDQEAITPQEDELTENNDVLQKIKSLGFTENQIKETPDYFLADGDLYFSKKISSNTTAPAKKTGHRILEKYATLTIRVDESLASAMDEHWRAGIDQAIAEWNANEQVHFHFAFTNSTDANINIVKDTDLPNDLAIASEFPRDGRTGSSIRINVEATTAVKDPKQAFAHALEHCVGFLHSTSAKNKDVKINSGAATSARGPRFDLELYAIQGDILYRINGRTGDYYALKEGWAGTELMGQMDGTLYVVQLGMLYAVNPSTGSRTPLNDTWGGSVCMTNIPGNRLYIVQDTWLWPVDPATGLWDGALGSYTNVRDVLGFLDPNTKKYRLALLRRKPGNQKVSILYTIKPSNGHIYTQGTIPASGVDDWNGKFFLASTLGLNVFNGIRNWITDDGQFRGASFPNPHIELVASFNGFYIYFIADGTLYIITQSGQGGPSETRLGDVGAWVETSGLVVLNTEPSPFLEPPFNQ